MAGTDNYQNIYGRRFGRGVRPWLLIPKVIFVGVFLGGVVSLLVLGFLQQTPVSPAEWTAQAAVIRQAYRGVIVPGLLGALTMGLALTVAHRGVLLRMRWLQAKLLLIVAFVPTFHLFMASRSLALQEAVLLEDFAAAARLREQLFRGTVATLVFAVVVILLGRLKPRLGQGYGKTFASRTAGQELNRRDAKNAKN